MVKKCCCYIETVNYDICDRLHHFLLSRSRFFGFFLRYSRFRLLHPWYFGFLFFNIRLFLLLTFHFSTAFVAFRLIWLIVTRVLMRRGVSSITIGWWVVCWPITILIVIGSILVAVVVGTYMKTNVERTIAILTAYKLDSSQTEMCRINILFLTASVLFPIYLLETFSEKLVSTLIWVHFFIK